MHTTIDADLCASAFFQPKIGTRTNRIITIGHGNNINNLVTTITDRMDFAQSRDRKNSRNLARTITKVITC